MSEPSKDIACSKYLLDMLYLSVIREITPGSAPIRCTILGFQTRILSTCCTAADHAAASAVGGVQSATGGSASRQHVAASFTERPNGRRSLPSQLPDSFHS